MKILQVISSLSAGGAEGFITNLSVSLSELGADVRVFALAGVRRERGNVLRKRLLDAGIQVIGAEERKPASFSNLYQLARLILSWKPDIVHANLYAAEVACVCARFMAIGIKSKYVRRLAGTDICSYRSKIIMRVLDHFFNKTIACSHAVADSYLNFMGKRFEKKVVVVRNGAFLLDAVPNADEKRQVRQSLDISPNAFVVAHIGRMLGAEIGSTLKSEPKAQDILLQAFAQAFRNAPESLLILVGDGPLRKEAEQLAESLGIKEQVRFLGEQPEPWPALKAADVFCFPSRHEGLPNALVEAASCGLPVVASDIPPIRALYPGDAWLLEPVDDVARFANALRTVRDSLDAYKQRAYDAAQGFRESFSMKACAMQYLEAYHSLFAR